MGHSQADKARSRERILAEASRRVRDVGLDSVSLGALMKSVGLTHGGFYGHFETREALLVEALERALREGETKIAADGAPAPYSDIVRGYLSPKHRDSRDTGCAIAALVSDVARADRASREVMTKHLETLIATLAGSLGDDEDRAILAVSAMVGALCLSRVIADPVHSNAILKIVREHLEALGRSALS